MKNIRNIAIIAHVDHGKTTLVDRMLSITKVIDSHKLSGELIMDNNPLERERGITILAKNVAVSYKGYKINIIDTPGHADFGGEVERVLNMADGVLLLVDAFEGPMPQTRFVTQKAIELGHKLILVINKVDKPNSSPEEAYEAVFELMISLGASEEQLDFPVIYGSAKQGWMSHDWKQPTSSIEPLMDAIIQHIPPPRITKGTLQLLITSIDYSPYIGRFAIGKLQRGTLQSGQNITLLKRNGTEEKQKIKDIFLFEGFKKIKADTIEAGDICAITGLEKFEIGDTIADPLQPEVLPGIKIEEPTMSMLFTINNSPFFGKEGKFVTSRHLKERLERELEKNLALRVEPGPSSDSFIVSGRGVLHLSILIETMRREGYELQIGQPKVIFKEINGQKYEPIEELTIDLPNSMHGKAIELVSPRKAELRHMQIKNDRAILTFLIPSRGLIGLKNELMTQTSGEAIMTHRFYEYQPYKGTIPGRINGSLIVMETGTAVPYALHHLQDRGLFFIDPGEAVYEGQVIGEHNRPGDLVVNVTKTKKLTNIRAAGSDEKMKIAPPRKYTLEEALEYIQDDEYVEVTPQSIRLRKILLSEHERKRQRNKTLL